MIENFTAQEFECPCCEYQNMEDEFIAILNRVQDDWNTPLHIDSGYRCQMHNYAIGGAPSSAHMFGEAVDFSDVSGKFAAWITPKLESYGLWMESRTVTPTWVHLQIRPCKNRIFIP
jgi:zinc D-Ala-D-Ala carboxypeptidase